MLNRPQQEPKGKVRHNAAHLHCKLQTIFTSKWLCSLSIFLINWQNVNLFTQTNPVCKYTLRAFIVPWTSLDSPLEIHGLGCASFMLTARVFSLWGKPFVWSTHINARHVLIIIHACHVCHLHSCTARMRGGAKYETGQRSLLGILIISSAAFWWSVFLQSFPQSLIFQCPDFVLCVN